MKKQEYYIKCQSATLQVEGHIKTIKGFKIGFHKENEGWRATEVTTGRAVFNTYTTTMIESIKKVEELITLIAPDEFKKIVQFFKKNDKHSPLRFKSFLKYPER